MVGPNFSLSWDSYQTSICNGLLALQQNGEFVDMTLAADGHYVKVHQMVMSLVSPYIKELIAATNCQHPVIFLNQISYETLCKILEYIYTGEVHIVGGDVLEILQAAKALHIKGLSEMNVDSCVSGNQTDADDLLHSASEDQGLQPQVSAYASKHSTVKGDALEDVAPDSCNQMDDSYVQSMEHDNIAHVKLKSPKCVPQRVPHSLGSSNLPLQYTLSSQGGIQMILNRYIYYLRYSGKKENNAHKRWQCIEYINTRCPAFVTTRGETIVQRVGSHTHRFHDKQILKRVQKGLIYSAVNEAEEESFKRKDKKDLSTEKDSE